MITMAGSQTGIKAVALCDDVVHLSVHLSVCLSVCHLCYSGRYQG